MYHFIFATVSFVKWRVLNFVFTEDGILNCRVFVFLKKKKKIRRHLHFIFNNGNSFILKIVNLSRSKIKRSKLKYSGKAGEYIILKFVKMFF